MEHATDIFDTQSIKLLSSLCGIVSADAGIYRPVAADVKGVLMGAACNRLGL